MGSENIQVKTQIDPPLRDALADLARAADRSLAGEMRQAVREYVTRRGDVTLIPTLPGTIREVLARVVAAREEFSYEPQQAVAILADLEAGRAARPAPHRPS